MYYQQPPSAYHDVRSVGDGTSVFRDPSDDSTIIFVGGGGGVGPQPSPSAGDWLRYLNSNQPPSITTPTTVVTTGGTSRRSRDAAADVSRASKREREMEGNGGHGQRQQFGDRLYAEGVRRKQQHDAQVSAVREEACQHLSFSPTVNKHSRSSTTGRRVVEESAAWEERRLARIELARRQQQQLSDQENTFHPKISLISASVAAAEHFSKEPNPVEERLLRKGREAAARMIQKTDSSPVTGAGYSSPISAARDHARQDHHNHHQQQPMHVGATTPRPRTPLKEVQREQVANRLYEKGVQQSRAEREMRRSQAEQRLQQECPFSPQLSKRTQDMVGDSIPSQQQGRHPQRASGVFHRLADDAVATAERKAAKKAELERSITTAADVANYVGPYSKLLGQLGAAAVHDDQPLPEHQRQQATSSSMTTVPRYARPTTPRCDSARSLRSNTNGSLVSSTTETTNNTTTASRRTGTPNRRRTAQEQKLHIDKMMEKKQQSDAAIERQRKAALAAELATTTGTTPTKSSNAIGSRRSSSSTLGGRRTHTSSSMSGGPDGAPSSVFERQHLWDETRSRTLARRREEVEAEERAKYEQECTFTPRTNSCRASSTAMSKSQNVASGDNARRQLYGPATGAPLQQPARSYVQLQQHRTQF